MTRRSEASRGSRRRSGRIPPGRRVSTSSARRVRELAGMLADACGEDRVSATRALGEMGAAARGTLAEMLPNVGAKDAELREATLRALAEVWREEEAKGRARLRADRGEGGGRGGEDGESGGGANGCSGGGARSRRGPPASTASLGRKVGGQIPLRVVDPRRRARGFRLSLRRPRTVPFPVRFAPLRSARRSRPLSRCSPSPPRRFSATSTAAFARRRAICAATFARQGVEPGRDASTSCWLKSGPTKSGSRRVAGRADPPRVLQPPHGQEQATR